MRGLQLVMFLIATALPAPSAAGQQIVPGQPLTNGDTTETKAKRTFVKRRWCSQGRPLSVFECYATARRLCERRRICLEGISSSSGFAGSRTASRQPTVENVAISPNSSRS